MTNPQDDFTPQENHMVETQAMNPAVTNEKGERVDSGEPGGSDKDSADSTTGSNAAEDTQKSK